MIQRQQPNYAERQLRKQLKDLVSPEQYAQIVQVLIDTAISGDKASDRINAAKIIIDRIEGKLPETIQHIVDSTVSVKDILGEG